MPTGETPPNVTDLGKRKGYKPDVLSLACSRVETARKRSGLSVSEFAAALEPLLGWAPLPGVIRAWESCAAAPPGHVVIACEVIAGSAVPDGSVQPGAAADAEIRLTSDRNVAASLNWLDRHAEWSPGTARRKVAGRLAGLDPRDLQDLGHRRSRVGRRQIAAALSTYYGSGFGAGYRPYRVRCDSGALETSVLTRADWLDLHMPLQTAREDIRLSEEFQPAPLELDGPAAHAAVRRLAEAVAIGGRLVNAPIYQLLTVQAAHGALEGTVGITEFVSYALTMDLLEAELIDAIADSPDYRLGALPLRDRFLPDVETVVELDKRVCAGGPLALCAIARPGSRTRRNSPDYVLLVQERSGSVLNSAQRLAVIPKAFHGPMSDPGDDAALAATLERELEEELFGRDDVDSTLQAQRRADPMHPSLLSAPMRWLADHAGGDSWSMECTGFGLNLVSGNYEFASLIVIDDEEWWGRFGGSIEANWESAGLRSYSSLDCDLLAQLCQDPSWSNEGLFALLQGFRRLADHAERRVNLPTIEVEA
jgi:hypothetical protein